MNSNEKVAKEELSVVLKVKIGDNLTNALLDTGAGCSVIDAGTLEKFGLEKLVQRQELHLKKMCVDASGNAMKIIGRVHLNTRLLGTDKQILQEFRVLDTKSCSNIILGRDYLRCHDEITFDFAKCRLAE